MTEIIECFNCGDSAPKEIIDRHKFVDFGECELQGYDGNYYCKKILESNKTYHRLPLVERRFAVYKKLLQVSISD